jgi:hypothetical protein
MQEDFFATFSYHEQTIYRQIKNFKSNILALFITQQKYCHYLNVLYTALKQCFGSALVICGSGSSILDEYGSRNGSRSKNGSGFSADPDSGKI